MTETVVPRIPKWPFLLGDLALLAVAGWIAYESGAPMNVWTGAICLAAVALGAWVCVMPFLREDSAAVRLIEVDSLATSLQQIQNIDEVKSRIIDATAHWQAINDQAAKAAQSAREVTDRMNAQVREFQDFFQRSNDQEKNTLRLEIDKAKRAEGEWLQVMVRTLDYVYALYLAGVRSGKPELTSELSQFQNACRDAARRVGLAPFAPSVGEAFDPRQHQAHEAAAEPQPGTPIGEVLATGYTFQAQLLRRSLVRVTAGDAESGLPVEDSVAAGEGESNLPEGGVQSMPTDDVTARRGEGELPL